MKKWAAILCGALMAVLLVAPPVAADDPGGGLVREGAELVCDLSFADWVGKAVGEDDLCKKTGIAVEVGAKKAWKAVWDSVIGDLVRACMDAGKWLIKMMLTFALRGPTVDLAETGLFGPDATLAGMLVWLGWVIAAFGVMWQLGRMAVTGQMKHAGRALMGWGENMAVTAVAVGLLALLITGVDKATLGIVDAVFDDADAAYAQIAGVLILGVLANPVIAGASILVVLLLGFITMLILFVRDIAIPIQALLLPIAGGGRTGGETMQKWLPKLCTSIFTVVFAKLAIAIVLCAGFAGMDDAEGLVAWFRGVVTLALACAAPFVLTKLFAPLGMAMGSGLAMGGALGAATNVATLFEKGRAGRGGARGGGEDSAEQAGADGGKGGGKGSGQSGAPDAVAQAQRLEKTMPSPGGNDAEKKGVPAQKSGLDAGGATGGGGALKPGGVTATVGAGAAGAAAGAGMALEVLDGVAAQAAGPGEAGDSGSAGAAPARVGAVPNSSSGGDINRIDVLDGTSGGVRGGEGT